MALFFMFGWPVRWCFLSKTKNPPPVAGDGLFNFSESRLWIQPPTAHVSLGDGIAPPIGANRHGRVLRLAVHFGDNRFHCQDARNLPHFRLRSTDYLSGGTFWLCSLPKTQ
jgi:hypothetical protein